MTHLCRNGTITITLGEITIGEKWIFNWTLVRDHWCCQINQSLFISRFFSFSSSFSYSIREVVRKKRIFYGQGDRYGWPPPLTVSCFVFFFWGLHLTSVFDYKWFETHFDKKKMFFDPLYDPLVVWRWAFQIEANTTTEPRMQWREAH